MTVPRNTLATKSKELFKDLHFPFCETISTAIIGKNANEICKKYCEFDDEWFERYYPELDKFDYIVLIARKGYSLFRAYLRTIKEDIEGKENKEAFSSEAKKTIILNTRTTCFYTFNKKIGSTEPKSIGEAKVLILDDLLNKGRNVSRITDNLLRLGIKNEHIYYSALGYYAIQKHEPEEDDAHTTWIEADKDKLDWYWLNFHKNANGGELEGKRIRLFIPYSIADESFLSSRAFFVVKSEANQRMFDFNSFIHYALIPYTDYTTSAYFNYLNDDQDANELIYNMYAKEKLFGNEELLSKGHSLDISSCKNAGVDVQSFIIKSNCDNGYYTSFRIMHNATRGELLFYPYIALPTLSKEVLCKLYKRLFAGVENLHEINTMMAYVYPAVGEAEVDFEQIRVEYISFIENYYVSDKLKWKNVYEHMARSISCVLSAIISVRYIVEERLFSDKPDECLNYAVTLFGKNLERFLGVKLIDDNKTFEMFLRKCIKNYEENLNLFEFDDPIDIECPEFEDLVRYYESDSKISEVKDLAMVCDHVGKHLTADEKEKPYFYLLDILKKISGVDEFSCIKLPPIPTYRVVESTIKCFRKTNNLDFDVGTNNVDVFRGTYGGDNVDADLFRGAMLALESLAEDGILNSSLYAEAPLEYPDRRKFFVMNGLQCGEMAILIGVMIMAFCGGWPMISELQSICLYSGKAELPSELEQIIDKTFKENSDIVKKKFEYVMNSASLFTYLLNDDTICDQDNNDNQGDEKIRIFYDNMWRKRCEISAVKLDSMS